MKTFIYLDNLLNRITIYRLLLYGLAFLLAIAIAFCFTGQLSLSGSGLIASTVLLSLTCLGINKLLSTIYRAPSNSESSLITALILALIMPPIRNIETACFVIICGLVAMSAKYAVSWRHSHLFNPAAFGAAVVGLDGLTHPSWWIGNPTMLPFTIFLGLLVVRKIRRFHVVIPFLIAGLMLSSIFAITREQQLATVLRNVILSGPLIFMGTIMLTEPSTMPSTRYYRQLYGVVVGLLFASQLHIFGQLITPEHALLIGNGLAFVISPKQRFRMSLQRIIRLTPTSYEFIFRPDRAIRFQPGQYLEWTLPHSKTDSRGNRRTFTIASSPTESGVHIGIKFYQPSSSFKTALSHLKPGDSIAAGQLSGNFTLPRDPAAKLIWIAGGIGVTPFRSMTQYLIDQQQPCDIIMFYMVSAADEVAYQSLFQSAASLGIKLISILNTSKPIPTDWTGIVGPLTNKVLTEFVPDIGKREAYISGPPGMVDSLSKQLRQSGARRVNTDHFAGY